MCNKCGSPKPIEHCGCEPVKFCGCSTKVDSKCVIYDACSLTPLGVIKGDNLEEIIKMINDMFSDVYIAIDNAFVGMNVGLGSEIYKGQNENGIEEFRTLEKGTGILLIQKDNTIEIKVDTIWLNSYLQEFMNESWFINHFQTLIKQQWFKDYLQTIFLEPWFGNLIQYWIKQDWFTTYLNQLFQQQWFINLLNTLLQQQWFINLLYNLFSTPTFQQFFANYIKNLFITGQIDICSLIANCNGTPTDTPPVMNGNIVYNVPNRAVNFPISESDFQSKYYDANGDTFTSIKITGGNLTNLTKTINGITTPLAINDVISVSNIGNIKFNGINQDPSYTQTVNYVAIASNGGQSN